MNAAYKWRITKDKYAYITIGTNDGNEQNIIDIILNTENIGYALGHFDNVDNINIVKEKLVNCFALVD